MIKRPIVALTLGRVSRIDANNAMFGANQINALGLRAIIGYLTEIACTGPRLTMTGLLAPR